MLTALLIYLVGCLFGFGVVASFINAGYYKNRELSSAKILFYGTFCSWLTVLALLLGIIKGFMGGSGDED